jgi:hypothetical protein
LYGQEGLSSDFFPVGVFAHRPALGRKPEFGVEGKVLEVVPRKVALVAADTTRGTDAQ